MDEIYCVSDNQIGSPKNNENWSQKTQSSSSGRNETSKGFCISISFMQKLMAELIGTYFLIFAGCGAIILNVNMENVVTLPGIALTWGMVVMVMIYSVGHISGAHFNPAVTIAFASCKKFPWKQVPAYILVQILASLIACGTLRLIYKGNQNNVFVTVPAGSNIQSLFLEFITTFYLMFVIAAIATSDQAIKEIAGIAIGATVSIDILFAGPVTGASMNPARSLGPAIISGNYKGLWIYIVGPISGAIAGAWVYNFTRFTYKPSPKIPRTKRKTEASSSAPQSQVRVTTEEKGNESSCKCGEEWTCFITKTQPSKAGKPYYLCGSAACSCVMVSDGVRNQEFNIQSSAFSGQAAVCECDEGWSCIVSKQEGSQECLRLFECGGGCLCVIDENNTVKIVLLEQWISRRSNV